MVAVISWLDRGGKNTRTIGNAPSTQEDREDEKASWRFTLHYTERRQYLWAGIVNCYRSDPIPDGVGRVLFLDHETMIERVHFRLIRMPCCGQLLCWVNPRLPTHCPECGKTVYTKLKFDGSMILITDEKARLEYNS